MPRRPRLCPIGIPQHIIQRGSNRQVCFACDENVAAYAHWLYDGAKKFGILVHAWVFMKNHIHLLATPIDVDGVSSLIQYLGRHYVHYFNHRYQRTGIL
ncbi:MAG: putative transposase [Cellvibrionaceae bacterium]|jgi:putative transposase